MFPFADGCHFRHAAVNFTRFLSYSISKSAGAGRSEVGKHMQLRAGGESAKSRDSLGTVPAFSPRAPTMRSTDEGVRHNSFYVFRPCAEKRCVVARRISLSTSSDPHCGDMEMGHGAADAATKSMISSVNRLGLYRRNTVALDSVDLVGHGTDQ